MQYKNTNELPKRVKELPKKAQLVWMEAYNKASKKYKSEAARAAQAWSITRQSLIAPKVKKKKEEEDSGIPDVKRHPSISLPKPGTGGGGGGVSTPIGQPPLDPDKDKKKYNKK
jgi:cation transport regulator ChaB